MHGLCLAKLISLDSQPDSDKFPVQNAGSRRHCEALREFCLLTLSPEIV